MSLEDLHMRKPFKSSCIIDQHTLDRQTLPSALAECYAACDPPPNLDALNPYRDDKKNALKLVLPDIVFFSTKYEKDCMLVLRVHIVGIILIRHISSIYGGKRC